MIQCVERSKASNVQLEGSQSVKPASKHNPQTRPMSRTLVEFTDRKFVEAQSTNIMEFNGFQPSWRRLFWLIVIKICDVLWRNLLWRAAHFDNIRPRSLLPLVSVMTYSLAAVVDSMCI